MPSVPGFDLEVIPVTPLSQNCSMFWNAASGSAVVVDPGGDVDRILARLAAQSATLEAIVLTHGHLDHAGGAAELSRRAGAVDAPVPVIGPHEDDRFLLDQLATSGLQFGISGAEAVQPDRFLVEGDVLHLAGWTLEVLHVPGHTPGHVVLFERTRRFLFAGDTIFRGTVGRTDFPYGDGALLIAGIREKLLPLGEDVLVLPGHGAMTRIGDERRHNPFLISN